MRRVPDLDVHHVLLQDILVDQGISTPKRSGGSGPVRLATHRSGPAQSSLVGSLSAPAAGPALQVLLDTNHQYNGNRCVKKN